ncbi:hypothetical protein BDQ17DRAFT_1356445 [Cyathus striatus]|nr:hypothetical protein BDQ17DRAFT_1356445 [Cyathus striatus]
MRLIAAATVSSLVSLAAAQMTIQVGAEATTSGGIFQFIPPQLNATNGTTVTFQFTGAPGNHSVTQSTFTDPCDPMAGGFDSGWVLIPEANSLSGVTTPTFNITITDDTKPIWFFCKQLVPSPHCPVGMIGAINAPTSGQNTFQAFEQNAQNFQGTPGQGQGGLVGVGASASALAGPIPSGLTLFTGSPVAASGSGAASATSSGSGAAAASGTSTSPSSSSSSSTSSSDALTLSGSTFSVVLAALLGYIIA